MYCYEVEKTGEVIELVQTVKQMESHRRSDGSFDLPEYGTCWRRMDIEHGGFEHPTSCWPMKSVAMACHPSQVREFAEDSRKKGVPTEFTKTGEPIFTNRNHRAKYLRAYRVHDRDGGYSET